MNFKLISVFVIFAIVLITFIDCQRRDGYDHHRRRRRGGNRRASSRRYRPENYKLIIAGGKSHKQFGYERNEGAMDMAGGYGGEYRGPPAGPPPDVLALEIEELEALERSRLSGGGGLVSGGGAPGGSFEEESEFLENQSQQSGRSGKHSKKIQTYARFDDEEEEEEEEEEELRRRRSGRHHGGHHQRRRGYPRHQARRGRYYLST